jgi:hypothetical protein
MTTCLKRLDQPSRSDRLLGGAATLRANAAIGKGMLVRLGCLSCINSEVGRCRYSQSIILLTEFILGTLLGLQHQFHLLVDQIDGL